MLSLIRNKELNQQIKKNLLYFNVTNILLRLAILGKVAIPRDSVRAVRSADEIGDIQKLLYREYRKKDLCNENKSKKFLNLFSLLPTSTTLISKRNEKLIGTIMIIEDGALNLPSDSLYHDELDEMRSRGFKLLEIGSLALDNSLFRKNAHSLTSMRKLISMGNLFTGMINYVYQFTDASHIVIMVNPKHASIYKKFGFEQYSEIRSYPGVNNKPAVPMIMDIERFFSSADKNISSLYATKCMRVICRNKKYTMSSLDVARLITDNPRFFADLTIKQEEALLKYYPGLQSILLMNRISNITPEGFYSLYINPLQHETNTSIQSTLVG